MWGNPELVTKETLDGYVRPLIRPGVFEHAIKIVRSWQTDMRELESVMPKIARLPILLVWGTKDRLVDPASANLMAEHLPGARLALIRGAGHLPYEERPEEFSRIVQEFLGDVAPAEITSSAREVT
jgi:pimeloyl-ACP methyl ester carboxylesterase